MKNRRSTLESTFIAALAVLMMLTSTAMANGQMRAAAVGEMVLCAGHDGPRVVQMDAEGQPVKPRVTCPDCLLDTGVLVTLAPTLSTPASFDVADLSGRKITTNAPRLSDSAYVTRAPPLG